MANSEVVTQLASQEVQLSIRNARLPAIKDKKRCVIRDHLFELHFFTRPTWCSHCTQFIFGLGKQGYQCLKCKYAVHKYCAELISFNCTCQSQSSKLSIKDEGVKHKFEQETEINTNTCDHCGQAIGGFFKKGYKCIDPICQMYVHDSCIEFVPDNCGFLQHKKFGSILLSLIYVNKPDGNVDLKITVHKARNLLPADSNGLSDPYCKIRINDAKGEAICKATTKIQFKTLNPVFDESYEWVFPYSSQCRMFLQVYDYDNLISSDFLGGMSMFVDEVKAYGTGDLMWFNLLSQDVWKTAHDLEEIESEEMDKIMKHVQTLRRNSQLDFYQRQQSKPQKLNRIAEEEPEKLSIDSFNLCKLIGKGGFGKVFLGEPKNAQGVFYAIKIIHKYYLVESDAIENIEIEKDLLIRYGKHDYLSGLVATFQDEFNVYIVLEYLGGGDLFNLVSKEHKLPIKSVTYYVAETSMGLFYLHNKGVIHRDLKLENIMLTLEGHVKIIDFGLSREGIFKGKHFTRTFCGTPTYMAPEIMNRGFYDSAVDLWSLGIITFELLTGLMPYNGFDVHTLKPLVKRLPTFPHTLSIPSVVFISHLLKYTPTERLGYNPVSGEASFRNSTFFGDLQWEELVARKLPPPSNPLVSTSSDRSSAIKFEISTGEPHHNLVIDQNAFKNFDYTEPGFLSTGAPLMEFSALD
ncbi:protein kinase C [Oopsacas minuta]|uniref:Protein kinase C n=1 Tax=Oopsacas minuta TaxID=111878 RepID=A0AAV7JV59_9METZ|nr:protein kinase C [Oopsacas minuta]